MLSSVRGLEIAWVLVDSASSLAGQTLAEANIRVRTEASVIAILRDQQVVANPKSATVLRPGDIVGLIGEAEHVAEARRLLAPEPAPVLVGQRQLGVTTLNLPTTL